MTTCILVVEDEILIAEDICETLQRLGYETLEAVPTAREAIECALSAKPNLVLMDVHLRGAADGIDAARAIRSRSDIPVVFLTSYSDDATLARAKVAQPHGYLLKPFTDRDLRTAIEVALHKHLLESQRAQRERWFSTTLASIGDAVIATDPREVLTFMNPVAERLTGWQEAEAIGKRIDEVFRVLTPSGEHRPISRALATAFAVELPRESKLVTRDGATVSIDDSAAAILDDCGTLLGGVVVFRDITEKQQLERRVAQSERLASLGTMIAGMAHEINNPLAYNLGNLEFSRDMVDGALADVRALEGPSCGERLAEIVDKLENIREALVESLDGAERIRRIVSGLRSFGRVEIGHHQLLELSDVLDTAVRMVGNTIRHHAHIERHYGITPYVEASEGQLVQVFVNILSNAAQAIPDGRAEYEWIRISTRTNDQGQAEIEVEDSGAGMTAETLARVFDPFFTTKRVGSGMGLGLSISYGIITSLEGEIRVASEVGVGTTVTVKLPSSDRRRASDVAAAQESLNLRRLRLLVVDDEPVVGKTVARMLQRRHDVTVVTSGWDALRELADEERFDFVLCDVMMPTMSGAEVYQAILAATPELAERVIFMTGGTFSSAADELLEKLPNRRIDKPFSLSQIEATLARALASAEDSTTMR